MAVSKSFKFLLAAGIVITILPKMLVGGGISNPREGEIIEAISPFFADEGYQTTAPVSFAARSALLAMKNDCLMYVIPVAHQGWHQAAVRQSIQPPQKLWFEFQGEVTEGSQDTYYPLSVYYFHKGIRYLGLDANYPPVLALVTAGGCHVDAIAWKKLPPLPFKARGIFE